MLKLILFENERHIDNLIALKKHLTASDLYDNPILRKKES